MVECVDRRREGEVVEEEREIEGGRWSAMIYWIGFWDLGDGYNETWAVC